jgi:hypothetical protein
MGTISTGLLGVLVTDTPTTNETGIALGTQVFGQTGERYIYVTAGGVIAQYAWVGYDEAFSATELTFTNAAAGHGIGVAQVAFASGDYGWVQTGGVASGKVAASCAADVALYTTTTAGVLDDATSAAGGTAMQRINGVVATTAVTAATNTGLILTYPHGL